MTLKNKMFGSRCHFSIGRPFTILYYRSHLKNFKITQITQKRYVWKFCIRLAFDLIELRRILEFTVDPTEIREFFASNQARCLGVLRPTEFALPARPSCYLKTFPFLEVFTS
jgi:hypothetical protein